MTHHRVLVAMSGGVDSSAAAVLLREAGYALVGATMRLGTGDEGSVEDARRVCERLDIPFAAFDFAERFQREVIDRFADGYMRGLTPNPCVDCNRYLKFGALLERARALGCDAIATGHYARIAFSERYGRWVLQKGAVPAKDQSYVLYSLTQDELAHTLLPLGGFEKREIRALAEAHGLENAHRKDSQDICFIPDGDHGKYLCERCGAKAVPGNFIDTSGKILGRHRGLIYYTVGQRRGLGISAERRLYVLDKNAADNTVTVGYEEELLCTRFTVRDVNWIAWERLAQPVRCAVRTRYHGRETPALLTPDGDCVRVELESPQRAVSPGQAAVFYDGETVLGGGTIA